MVDQSTIAANKPQQVYLAITERRHLFITHLYFRYCKPNRRSTLAPSSCSKAYTEYNKPYQGASQN